MKKTFFLLMIAAITAMMAVSCGDDPIIAVTGVTLMPEKVSIVVAGTKTLTPTVAPADATNQDVTWNSSAQGVATVAGGVVTAVAPGTATITVKTVDGGKTADCIVTVTAEEVHVTGVTFDQPTLELVEGDEATLEPTIEPAEATNQDVTWETSTPAVATVAGGVVTAVAPGTAKITVKTVDGGKTAECAVTVTAKEIRVTGVILKPETVSIVVGDNQKLEATVAPADATNKNVTWETSAPAVATVADGIVTAVAPGTAKITVKTVDGGKTAECVVTVTAKEVHVTGVTLDQPALTLVEGGNATLKPTVAPSEATNKDVTWETSAPAVATVAGGVVTAVAPGTAKIIVKTVDGGKTAECTVTVTAKEIHVENVSLELATVTLSVNDKVTLKHTITPANATNKNVTWESSAPAVATVNEGVVTAVAAGNAKIIVKTVDGGKTAECSVTVTAPKPKQKWARSNIVWVVDSSKPDGGYLTFAVTSDDNARIPANSQGMLFAWGSLVAISPVSGDYDMASSVIYSPTGTKNYQWDEIPSLSRDSTPPFDNDAATDDDFATYNVTGFDAAAGKGDVCRYISSKGWVEGDWRLPTGSEIAELIGEGEAKWSGAFFAKEDVTDTDNNPYGFHKSLSGFFFGTGVTAGDDKENPAAGVALSASGFRPAHSGKQTEAGIYGCYWSGSSKGVLSGRQLDVSSSSNSMTHVNRKSTLSVRCVRVR